MISLTSLSLKIYDTGYIENANQGGIEITELVSIIIGLTALIFTIYQGYRNRLHDRLSLRPLIRVSLEIETNCFELKLMNKGTGPAIFKEMEILYGIEETKQKNLIELVGNWVSKKDTIITTSIKDSVLLQRESTIIIKVEFKEDREIRRMKKLLRKMNHVTLNIKYEDLYEREFNHSFSDMIKNF